jgi:hypothetical protein
LTGFHRQTAYPADDDLVFAHPYTGTPLYGHQLLKAFQRALDRVMPERATWDQKLARAIRRLFQRLGGRMPGFEEWEREKLEAFEIEALEREMRRRDKRDRHAGRERNG